MNMTQYATIANRKFSAGPAARIDDPRWNRLPIEGARLLRESHRAIALVEQLDVAAKGNRRQAVLGAVGPGTSNPQGPPEADREAQHPDARAVRAAMKWPYSWTATSMPIATRNAAADMRKFM